MSGGGDGVKERDKVQESVERMCVRGRKVRMRR